MDKQSIRIDAPRRNPRRTYRDDSRIGVKMDMFKLRVLMLKALAELVVDVMEERGAVPPKQPWDIKQ